VDPALPLPKYHQVYLVLREQLAEGRFGGALPGELALADQFGVARVTVRRALERLAAEGWVDRSPGRGTVPRAVTAAASAAAASAEVAPRARAGPGSAPVPPALGGLLGHLVDASLRTRVRVLEVGTVPAAPAVAQVLQLAPGAPVCRARRLRRTRAGPLSLITTHVPAALADGIGRRALAREPMLRLLERGGVRIGGAQQSIGARLADAEAARHLDVAVGSALLAVNRLVHDEAGRPVQWLQGLYRPDRYEYRMQLSRVGEVDAQVWVGTELTTQFH
jgi:GntR family transcriptional regulator